MSGYDIKKFIEESVGYFWNESFGQIYPMLRTLEQEGLVAGEDTGERKVYALSAAGREALLHYLHERPEHGQLRDESLLKLFFGRNVKTATLLEHLAGRRAEAAASLEVYKSITARLKEQHAANPDLPFWLFTLRKGVLLTTAEIRWIDETMTELEEA